MSIPFRSQNSSLLRVGLTALKCVITKYGGQLTNIVQNFSYVGDVGSNAADATLARQ